MAHLNQPLKNITVVTLEHAVAAPFASRQLADLGARVIKIEKPKTGDFARYYDSTVYGEASFFVWTNSGKESLILDIKKKEDNDVLVEILSKADVFIQNLAPGAAKRQGLGFKDLKAINPKIIVCNISGYGDGGELSQKKSYDLLIQCASGLVNITGTPEQQSRVGVPIADIAAGMYAFTGVLAAIIQRHDREEAIEINISMLESLLEWMGYPLLYTKYGEKDIARLGLEHPTISPYGKYICKDEQEIIFGLQNEEEWASFVTHVLESPELLADERFNSNIKRVQNRKELDSILQLLIQEYEINTLIKKLDQARIANSPINLIQNLYDHQHLKQRNRWVDVLLGEHSVKRLIPPYLEHKENWPATKVPCLGEHTSSIKNEFQK